MAVLDCCHRLQKDIWLKDWYTKRHSDPVCVCLYVVNSVWLCERLTQNQGHLHCSLNIRIPIILSPFSLLAVLYFWSLVCLIGGAHLLYSLWFLLNSHRNVKFKVASLPNYLIRDFTSVSHERGYITSLFHLEIPWPLPPIQLNSNTLAMAHIYRNKMEFKQW